MEAALQPGPESSQQNQNGVALGLKGLGSLLSKGACVTWAKARCFQRVSGSTQGYAELCQCSTELCQCSTGFRFRV